MRLQGKYLAADGGPPEARLNKYKGRYAEAESR
jgi:N-acetyltransferase 10